MNRIICWLVICVTIGCNAYHIDQTIPNAQTYHNQQDDEDAFNYGYQVENINNQFQHKQKGPDDVTYGCYGYVDPDRRKQLTFFVADRLGYRVVLTGQPTTVYPLTSTTLELSVVSGGRQIQWKDLPFPAACQPNDVASASSSVPSQADLQGQRFDDAYAAESRDAFQRTLLEPVNRNPTGDAAVTRPQPFDSQRPSANYQAIANLGPRQQEALGQLDSSSSSSSNNNAAINAQASTGNAANQPDKGQAAGQSAASGSWQPFLGTSNSFMLSSQCERAGGHPGGQTLTLYIPFRISCSDMQAFEAALAKLTAQFNRAEC